VKLEQTLRALYDAGVEFVLIGGAAMQLQGSAYMTEDLDFCYARSPQNIRALAQALGPTIRASEMLRKIFRSDLMLGPSNAG
jgi:hypothetical protein